MTAPWWTGVVVILKLVSSAEASMTEPAICYILDGILLFYCLITTLLFFRAKCKSSPEPKEDPTHAELKPGANADDQQSAATRRKRKQETSSDTYQALQIKDDGNDDYQVIMSKGRKNKKAQVPQPLSAKTQTRATAPPLPPH
ncbi:high affinity immunoglobulin epsilon receptor subunit gamma isoform X1 [Salmo trutta]|uniref:high affinity immunoglobulin epsilon receptor subunit gamma isoform X1 n=2 Tax=Salmo trutta TaxID=8032 RepID=UPI0011310ADC|nr:high affinity immunoglobulin epsilon receptor subunit gamma-like isoform X1 [Salmo trutta]